MVHTQQYVCTVAKILKTNSLITTSVATKRRLISTVNGGNETDPSQ